MNDAVNENCPWSGEPVASDSLTLYRGRTVGFCNPGCRDKFETATAGLDRAIAEQDPFPRGGAAAFAPYTPRHVASLGLWEIGDMRLKLSSMTFNEETETPGTLIDAARQFTEKTLPPKRILEGEDHKVGFAILHLGEMGAWLLVHWWAHGDIQLSFLAMAPPGTEQFHLQRDRHFHSCVWEQVVIGYERDAWVTHVMNGGGRIENYLSARLADGSY